MQHISIMQYILHLQINAYIPFTSRFTALPLYYSCNSTHASSTSSTATHCNIGCNTLQHRLQYLKHEYTLHENTQQHMLQCVAVRCSAHMLHICCSAHMLHICTTINVAVFHARVIIPPCLCTTPATAHTPLPYLPSHPQN